MSERLCMDLDEVRKLLRDYKHRADRAAEVLESTRTLSEQRRQEIERLRLRVAELEAGVEEVGERYLDLHAAAHALYFAGGWALPIERLPGEVQASMWCRLRDALGLAKGTARAAGVARPDAPPTEPVEGWDGNGAPA